MNKLFAYPGGKTPIRKQVVSVFPPHESYSTYIDVFGGSAAILLEKEPSAGEIFNDKNEQLVNFFRVVKHRPAELAERAKHWLHSRALWNEFRNATVLPADEVERAFIFWCRLQDSFGGMGMTFGTCRQGIHSVTKAREYLDQVSQRLKGVHIDCTSFERCIKAYDSPDAFFYLDPPYPNTKGGENNYNLLSLDEWSHLKKILDGISGKFLLSCNDDPFVVKLFKGYELQRLKARVTLAKENNPAPRTEILVSNYSMPKLVQQKYAADRPAARQRRKVHVRKKDLA